LSIFDTVAILITLSALFGYVNHRFIKLPTVIGLMLISILMSFGLFLLGYLHLGYEKPWMDFVKNIDFNKTLMVGMLSFLLFAGALHVDVDELLKQRWEVIVYATVGVVISTVLVGAMTHVVLDVLGIKIKFIYCLLFGALISPTDPIAILGILRRAAIPKGIEVQIAGESLFNDGVGVVLFTVLLEMAISNNAASVGSAFVFFAEETVGGAFLGFLLGWTAYKLLKSIDNYQVEILITISLVMGGYALASALHTSGPIAIVVAGLLIGKHGRTFAMSDTTRRNLDMFWEFVDEILNSVLFILIGLELLVINLSACYLIAAMAAVPIVLLARTLSIGLPMRLFSFRKPFDLNMFKIMIWGGLRGGIAVALVLSLPSGVERDLLVTMTYVVVVFSILVQGLTLKYVMKR
jgi:CPA1 family monovalent cation:H+ antiporter